MRPNRKRNQIITTGGTGYIPDAVDPYSMAIRILSGGLPEDTIRNRLYQNLYPIGYDNVVKQFQEAVKNNKTDYRVPEMFRDDIFAQYLGIPENKRRGISKIRQSKYKPTIGTEHDKYYSLPLLESEKDLIINDAMNYTPNGRRRIAPPLQTGQNKLSNALSHYLGQHTIGKGIDPNKGNYISYYDKWDLSPFPGTGDQSGGIGTPVNIYDRIYLDDYYDVDSSARRGTYYGGYIPEITITPRKK